MKRILTAILALTLLLIFVGCQSDVFESCNREFFRRLLSREEENGIKIESLDAYFYEECYYYDVKYSYVDDSGKMSEIELVYFGRGTVNNYINPNWSEFGDMIVHLDEYYDAVTHGEHKSFTDEEIAGYVNDFYDSRVE